MADLVVSVVLPIYNESANLAPLFAELAQALGGVSHEIVAVDDGSTDDSAAELRRLRERHPTLRVISLERRAGQSAAVMAGVAAARSPLVATMDADGQNDPADVPRLLSALEGDPGAVAIVGYRVRRADSWWKRTQSRIANAVRNWITKDRVRDTGCSLKLMRRDATLRLPRFDGVHRFLPTLLRRDGGRVVQVPVSHRPRRFGVSKYGAADRAWRGLRDAFGVRWLGRRALRYRITQEPGKREPS